MLLFEHSLAAAVVYACKILSNRNDPLPGVSSLGVLFCFNALFLTVRARIQFTYVVASSDTSASSGGLEEGFSAS